MISLSSNYSKECFHWKILFCHWEELEYVDFITYMAITVSLKDLT